MSSSAKEFKERVNQIVNSIPRGKVMTYGQVATLAGSPRAARVVGQIAHFGDINMPWHRIVNKKGGLAKEFSYGGIEAHRRFLEKEDVEVDGDTVINLDKYLEK